MMKKAFVYSLDAFVALTIATLAINLLIYFYSIPTAYYPVLYQCKALATDTLRTLITTDTVLGNSYLDAIVKEDGKTEILDSLIPAQYGYELEVDGKVIASRGKYRKVKASSVAVVVGAKEPRNNGENWYRYKTCKGTMVPCEPLPSTYNPGKVYTSTVKLTVFI